MNARKIRCHDDDCPCPPSPEEILAGGLLCELDGKLAVLGPKRLLKVEVGEPAPGKHSWIVSFDATNFPLPVPSYNYIVFGQQVQEGDPNLARPYYPRCQFLLSTNPPRLEVFLVDGAGGLVDAFGSGATIPFSILRGSSDPPLLT